MNIKLSRVSVLLVVFFCVLLMHVGFAALVLYHDYFSGETWVETTRAELRGSLPESWTSFVYWAYVYVPVFLLVYGFVELWPLWRVFRERKHLTDRDVGFHDPQLVTLTQLASVIGLLLMLLMWEVKLGSPSDHFAFQGMIVIVWGMSLKIGWLIGRQ